MKKQIKHGKTDFLNESFKNSFSSYLLFFRHLSQQKGCPVSLQKLFLIFILGLFSLIGILSFFNKSKNPEVQKIDEPGSAIVVELFDEVRPVEKEKDPAAITLSNAHIEEAEVKEAVKEVILPQADRVHELFRKTEPKLPIVETITYKSHVDWLKGRPAWLSDYASHYKTSRHFIARSLHGKPDYFKQDLAIGDRFNVFKRDKDISFYLVIDLSRSKMWFYYYDKGDDERVLLKQYSVGLGRPDGSTSSGLLTPSGAFELGDKIAIYKPKQKGLFNGEKTEMIRVFGTRWIPFEKEIDGDPYKAKGFGLHGAPWIENEKGELVEDKSCIGKYESDGCVRLASEDIEELFSIIITKPSYVLLVKDFFDAKLPGKEK